jgi:hypothetical protein
MDDHYKAQVDAIAEALQELVSGPDDSVEKRWEPLMLPLIHG